MKMKKQINWKSLCAISLILTMVLGIFTTADIIYPTSFSHAGELTVGEDENATLAYDTATYNQTIGRKDWQPKTATLSTGEYVDKFEGYTTVNVKNTTLTSTATIEIQTSDTSATETGKVKALEGAKAQIAEEKNGYQLRSISLSSGKLGTLTANITKQVPITELSGYNPDYKWETDKPTASAKIQSYAQDVVKEDYSNGKSNNAYISSKNSNNSSVSFTQYSYKYELNETPVYTAKSGHWVKQTDDYIEIPAKYTFTITYYFKDSYESPKIKVMQDTRLKYTADVKYYDETPKYLIKPQSVSATNSTSSTLANYKSSQSSSVVAINDSLNAITTPIAGKNVVNVVNGSTYQIPYEGASTGTGEKYVSCAIYKKSDTTQPIYYGRLGKVTEETGTVNLTIPSSLKAGTDYLLAVFEETASDENNKTYTMSTPNLATFTASSFDSEMTDRDSLAPADAKGFHTYVDESTNLTWHYKYNDHGEILYLYTEDDPEPIISDGGVLIIPSTINGLPVVGIGGGVKGADIIPFVPLEGDNANDTWNSIYFPSTLKHIGDGAFLGLSNEIHKLTIPGTMESVGVQAFMGDHIEYITINDASNLLLSTQCFAEIEELKDVKLRGNGITIGQHAFSNDTGITELNIPYGTKFTKSVPKKGKDINPNDSYAFIGLENLKTVKIDAETVPSNCFAGNRNLETVIFGEHVKRVAYDWSGTGASNSATDSNTVPRLTYALNAETIFEFDKTSGGSPFGYANELTVVGKRFTRDFEETDYNNTTDPVTATLKFCANFYKTNGELYNYVKGSGSSITITVKDAPEDDEEIQSTISNTQTGIEAVYDGSIFTGYDLIKDKMTVYKMFGNDPNGSYKTDEFYVLRTDKAQALFDKQTTDFEANGQFVATQYADNTDIIKSFEAEDSITVTEEDLEKNALDVTVVILNRDSDGNVLVDDDARRITGYMYSLAIPVKAYTEENEFFESYGSYAEVITAIHSMEERLVEDDEAIAAINNEYNRLVQELSDLVANTESGSGKDKYVYENKETKETYVIINGEDKKIDKDTPSITVTDEKGKEHEAFTTEDGTLVYVEKDGVHVIVVDENNKVTDDETSEMSVKELARRTTAQLLELRNQLVAINEKLGELHDKVSEASGKDHDKSDDPMERMNQIAEIVDEITENYKTLSTNYDNLSADYQAILDVVYGKDNKKTGEVTAEDVQKQIEKNEADEVAKAVSEALENAGAISNDSTTLQKLIIAAIKKAEVGENADTTGMTKDMVDAINSIKELKAELDNLNAQVNAIQTGSDGMQSMLAALSNALGYSDTQTQATIIAAIQSLKDQVKTLTEKNESLTAQVVSLTKENADLKNSSNNTKTTTSNNTGDYKTGYDAGYKVGYKEGKNDGYDKTDDTIVSLKQKNQKLSDKNTELTKKNTELENNNKTLQKDINVYEASIDAMYNTFLSSGNKANNLDANATGSAQYTNKMNVATAMFNEVNALYKESSTLVTGLNKKVSSLTSANTTLKKTNTSLGNKVDSLTKELEKYKNKSTSEVHSSVSTTKKSSSGKTHKEKSSNDMKKAEDVEIADEDIRSNNPEIKAEASTFEVNNVLGATKLLNIPSAELNKKDSDSLSLLDEETKYVDLFETNGSKIVESTASQKENANNIFKYYKSDLGELATLGSTDAEEAKESDSSLLSIEALGSFDLVASEEQSKDLANGNKAKVSVSSDLICDGTYLVIHESEVRTGTYDILVVASEDGTLNFELEDLSPISIAKISLTESIVPASMPKSQDTSESATVSHNKNFKTIFIIVALVAGFAAAAFILFAAKKPKAAPIKRKERRAE